MYDNTNRFSLFKNNKKSKPGDADFSGTLNIDGVEYWINAWRPKEGSKLVLSGSVRLKGAKAGGAKPSKEVYVPEYKDDYDETIPF